MFNSLKEKLKGWISKNKEEETAEKLKKSSKKEIKKTKKTPKKEKILKKETKNLEKTEKEILEDDPTKEIIKEKKGFFDKFQKKLTPEKFEEIFEELELILMQNNVAYEAIDSIKESLKRDLVGENEKKVNLEESLKNSIEKILINPPSFIEDIKDSLKEKKPYVILFAGINGAGKTTTIAKIAKLLQKNKLSVCLAAGDTFRAASIEQLEQHAKNLEVPLIKKDYGNDPASVGYDAINYAKKNKIDVVLIDTAGRLQNKDSLMKELGKIVRVTSPDLKIFLGESITGNDATIQAKEFNETIKLDGIILSKADVDEKGGTAISVSCVTNKPIYFLGTGQSYEDLEIFNKDKIIKSLGF